MKLTKISTLVAVFACIGFAGFTYAQEIKINYDEAKIEPYTLPDLLVCNNGKTVSSASQWTKHRRAEILQIFTDDMYGSMPPAPKGIHFRQIGEDQYVYDELAIRRRILVCLDSEEKHTFELLIHIPASKAKPVPVFVGLNFSENQQGDAFPGNDGILNPGSKWYGRWPIEQIIKAGFAVATATRNSIEPDSQTDWTGGIRQWYDEMFPGKYSWGVISAWAWGMSRIVDYLQTDPDINSSQIVAIGHSRLGKTALWAGANDLRFKIMISNEAGSCGASIARRKIGANFSFCQRYHTTWFCRNFQNFTEYTFPTDMHGLSALSAPRPLYIGSAEKDLWSDPKGEWLCAKSVQPVYDLFGKKGLEGNSMPAVGGADDRGTVGYHIRSGEHNVTSVDWEHYLNFARRHFGM